MGHTGTSVPAGLFEGSGTGQTAASGVAQAVQLYAGVVANALFGWKMVVVKRIFGGFSG